MEKYSNCIFALSVCWDKLQNDYKAGTMLARIAEKGFESIAADLLTHWALHNIIVAQQSQCMSLSFDSDLLAVASQLELISITVGFQKLITLIALSLVLV